MTSGICTENTIEPSEGLGAKATSVLFHLGFFDENPQFRILELPSSDYSFALKLIFRKSTILSSGALEHLASDWPISLRIL